MKTAIRAVLSVLIAAALGAVIWAACHATPIQWRGMEGPKTFHFAFDNDFIETCVEAGFKAWTGAKGATFTKVASGGNIKITWEPGGDDNDWARASVFGRNNNGHVTDAQLEPSWTPRRD
jgi:hypothetical protein